MATNPETMPAGGRTPLEDPTLAAQEQAARSGESPRLGLALSGGGFRAAIFHLGVIRRLEEIGLMPYISVISTVSGGSIIGAYYAIEMERYLRSQPPEHLAQPDVRMHAWESIAGAFLRAVEENLRSRALVFSPFFHPILFAKSLLLAPFRKGARSILIQAEYDRWFYDHNTLDELPAVSGAASLSGRPEVRGPKLVLNTTSLFSGDRKAFSRDANSRLAELKTSNKNVLTLAQVVGASSGVPVLFPPTPIAGDLLVDGGVSDNQGIEGLDQEKCNVQIISDASGQLEIAHTQSTSELSIFARTNDILQHQVRAKLLDALSARYKMEKGFRFAFFHLYLNLKDDPRVGDDRLPTEFIQPTARIRTDLDQFSSIECEALLYHGYTLAGCMVRNWLGPLTVARNGYDAPPVVPPDVVSKLDEPFLRAPLFHPDVQRDDRCRELIKRELKAGEQKVYAIRCLRKFPGPSATVGLAYIATTLAAMPVALSILSPIQRKFSEWFDATSFGAFSQTLDWLVSMLLAWVGWLTPQLRKFPALDSVLPPDAELARFIHDLPAATKTVPREAVFIVALLFAVFLVAYVIAFPFWVWLRRWALNLDRKRYKHLTGLDSGSLDWTRHPRPPARVTGSNWWRRALIWIRRRWMGEPVC